MNGEYQSYKIEDAAGVLRYRAVVRGAAEGGVKKPAAANEGKFVGITQDSQAVQNKAVTVKTQGRSFVVAAGVIAYGDAVGIGDNTGKVISAQTDYAAAAGVAKNVYVIGFAETAAGADGDIIEINIQPQLVKTAAS